MVKYYIAVNFSVNFKSSKLDYLEKKKCFWFYIQQNRYFSHQSNAHRVKILSSDKIFLQKKYGSFRYLNSL